MPILETALNSALAEALSAHDLHATPEQTLPKTGADRCDVLIRRKHGDRYFTAVECKIGQDKQKQQAAVKDAQRWLRQSDCWNAVAVCYPQELSEAGQATTLQTLGVTNDLLMVKVSQGSTIGHWRRGSVSALAVLADDVGANETYAVTEALRRAILAASERLDQATGRDLAEILELPWDARKGSIDPRPARIACLIIANMALLQNRMTSEGRRIKGLKSLVSVRQASNKQIALIDNWNRIRKVDYAPVVDPALAVLYGLPSDHHTDSMIDTLIEAVLGCAPRIRGLQLDHAGPLYHGLLQSARYDGSFYTSTSAAVLLAELAMPSDWPLVDSNWADASNLAKLKICDPACGTGTLLMAAARTIEERFRAATGNEIDPSSLHLDLIQDVLHGLDINRHAIHLAASMLTLSAPKIDYDKMNLYNMLHGATTSGEIRAGSLDILVDDAEYIPTLAPVISQERTTATGYKEEVLQLKGACDLVIMNPPFTRNDVRNRHLPPKIRRQVQQREQELAKSTSIKAHRNAISQSAMGTFFIPIADLLLADRGTLAIVFPTSALTSTSRRPLRNLLLDPSLYQLELVVTSHDNRRIAFSENTDIHESLIVARRPTPENGEQRSAFVSLAENPVSVSEAHFLANAIRQALDGDSSLLADYGTLAWRSRNQLLGRPWNAVCFYDQGLADTYDLMLENSALWPMGDLASVEPEGRRTRDSFNKAERRQNPDMRALWAHKSDRQTAMRTSFDEYLVAKKDKQEYAADLWDRRSNLLVSNRFYPYRTQTPAVYVDEPVLGNAFVPVSPMNENKEETCKAWCAWLNSTFGIIAFLNIRQKKLTYPNFSLDGLRSLPVPNPARCDMAALAAVYEDCANEALQPLPKVHADPVRRRLDEAVLEAVPELSSSDLPRWRKSISLEPSVNNAKEPVEPN